jgi:DNA (cytosine-5)-methyltransferase 1
VSAQERMELEAADAFVRPTMDEVLATPRNGLRAAGSFSGCGGSALGLRMAGWSVDVGVEFIPAAAECYRRNLPDCKLLEKDIRAVKGGEIRDAMGLDVGELDLWEGSPPCASFVPIGARGRGWGQVRKYSDTEQRTDDLFWEWIRLMGVLRPRAILAENVPGMLSGAALHEYAHAVTRGLGEMGYRVAARLVNSSWFGVPQNRRRLIFLGYREDLGLHPFFPDGARGWPVTLGQALASVDPADPDHAPFLEDSSMVGYATGRTWEWKRGQRDKGVCARCGERNTAHAMEVRDTKAIAGGRKLTGVTVCADGERGVEVKDYDMLLVPSLDDPCPTITAGDARPADASVTHPTECRKLTPAECKAVCAFPLDFVLTGTREQRVERMGRAVTPPVYEAFGERIARSLTERTT